MKYILEIISTFLISIIRKSYIRQDTVHSHQTITEIIFSIVTLPINSRYQFPPNITYLTWYIIRWEMLQVQLTELLGLGLGSLAVGELQ